MSDSFFQGYLFITDLSIYSIILPLGVVAFNYKNLTVLQRLIGGLVIITLIGELASYYTAYIFKNNIPVFHLFTLIQFIVLITIIKKGLFPFFSKLSYKRLIIAFIIFALLDAFWWSGINNFNNYARPLSSILLICCALLFFYKTLKELKIKSLEQEPLFWLSIGILIYHSGSLLVFLFSNYVKSSEVALLTLWGIHAIFNIFLNLSYAIALWVKPPN